MAVSEAAKNLLLVDFGSSKEGAISKVKWILGDMTDDELDYVRLVMIEPFVVVYFDSTGKLWKLKDERTGQSKYDWEELEENGSIDTEYQLFKYEVLKKLQEMGYEQEKEKPSTI